MMGDFEGELKSGRLVRHRFPYDPRYLHSEARALAALGRLRELDALLVESLEYRSIPGWGPPGLRVHITASDELRAHGRDSASRAVLERAVAYYLPSRSAALAGTRHPFDLARALYQLGRLDEARRIVDRLANDRGPRVLAEFELRTLTGYVAAAQRDSVTIDEIDRWLREMTDPYIRGANTEARARLAALLGRREEAVRLLRDANAEGQGFTLGYHAQFEFATLRGFEPFEEWLRPKD
jgi:tetratricopeptide (TPR) repeat protein